MAACGPRALALTALGALGAVGVSLFSILKPTTSPSEGTDPWTPDVEIAQPHAPASIIAGLGSRAINIIDEHNINDTAVNGGYDISFSSIGAGNASVGAIITTGTTICTEDSIVCIAGGDNFTSGVHRMATLYAFNPFEWLPFAIAALLLLSMVLYVYRYKLAISQAIMSTAAAYVGSIWLHIPPSLRIFMMCVWEWYNYCWVGIAADLIAHCVSEKNHLYATRVYQLLIAIILALWSLGPGQQPTSSGSTSGSRGSQPSDHGSQPSDHGSQPDHGSLPTKHGDPSPVSSKGPCGGGLPASPPIPAIDPNGGGSKDPKPDGAGTDENGSNAPKGSESDTTALPYPVQYPNTKTSTIVIKPLRIKEKPITGELARFQNRLLIRHSVRSPHQVLQRMPYRPLKPSTRRESQDPRENSGEQVQERHGHHDQALVLSQPRQVSDSYTSLLLSNGDRLRDLKITVKCLRKGYLSELSNEQDAHASTKKEFEAFRKSRAKSECELNRTIEELVAQLDGSNHQWFDAEGVPAGTDLRLELYRPPINEASITVELTLYDGKLWARCFSGSVHQVPHELPFRLVDMDLVQQFFQQFYERFGTQAANHSTPSSQALVPGRPIASSERATFAAIGNELASLKGSNEANRILVMELKNELSYEQRAHTITQDRSLVQLSAAQKSHTAIRRRLRIAYEVIEELRTSRAKSELDSSEETDQLRALLAASKRSCRNSDLTSARFRDLYYDATKRYNNNLASCQEDIDRCTAVNEQVRSDIATTQSALADSKKETKDAKEAVTMMKIRLGKFKQPMQDSAKAQACLKTKLAAESKLRKTSENNITILNGQLQAQAEASQDKLKNAHGAAQEAKTTASNATQKLTEFEAGYKQLESDLSAVTKGKTSAEDSLKAARQETTKANYRADKSEADIRTLTERYDALKENHDRILREKGAVEKERDALAQQLEEIKAAQKVSPPSAHIASSLAASDEYRALVSADKSTEASSDLEKVTEEPADAGNVIPPPEVESSQGPESMGLDSMFSVLQLGKNKASSQKPASSMGLRARPSPRPLRPVPNRSTPRSTAKKIPVVTKSSPAQSTGGNSEGVDSMDGVEKAPLGPLPAMPPSGSFNFFAPTSQAPSRPVEMTDSPPLVPQHGIEPTAGSSKPDIDMGEAENVPAGPVSSDPSTIVPSAAPSQQHGGSTDPARAEKQARNLSLLKTQHGRAMNQLPTKPSGRSPFTTLKGSDAAAAPRPGVFSTFSGFGNAPPRSLLPGLGLFQSQAGPSSDKTPPSITKQFGSSGSAQSCPQPAAQGNGMHDSCAGNRMQILQYLKKIEDELKQLFCQKCDAKEEFDDADLDFQGADGPDAEQAAWAELDHKQKKLQDVDDAIESLKAVRELLEKDLKDLKGMTGGSTGKGNHDDSDDSDDSGDSDDSDDFYGNDKNNSSGGSDGSHPSSKDSDGDEDMGDDGLVAGDSPDDGDNESTDDRLTDTGEDIDDLSDTRPLPNESPKDHIARLEANVSTLQTRIDMLDSRIFLRKVQKARVTKNDKLTPEQRQSHQQIYDGDIARDITDKDLALDAKKSMEDEIEDLERKLSFKPKPLPARGGLRRKAEANGMKIPSMDTCGDPSSVDYPPFSPLDEEPAKPDSTSKDVKPESKRDRNTARQATLHTSSTHVRHFSKPVSRHNHNTDGQTVTAPTPAPVVMPETDREQLRRLCKELKEAKSELFDLEKYSEDVLGAQQLYVELGNGEKAAEQEKALTDLYKKVDLLKKEIKEKDELRLELEQRIAQEIYL